MSFTNINRFTCSLALLIGTAVAWTSLGAQAQGTLKTGARAGAAARPGVRPGEAPRPFPVEAPGELVVRVAPGVDGFTLAARYGAQARKLRYTPDTYVFTGVQGSLTDTANHVRAQAGVLQAQTNRYYRPLATPQITPNDEFLRQQWALRLVNAPDVWGITVGERLVNGPRKNVVVALIDFGPETFHQDLFGKFDPRGWDFINDQPYDPFLSPTFQEGHGTNVASTIATCTNNSEGIASVPWEAVSMLVCAVGEVTGTPAVSVFRTSAILDAINYAIDQGVDVINMSFGIPVPANQVPDPLIRAAVADAYDQGVVLVGAGGDSSFSFFNTVDFPARLPEVIAVGAVGPQGEVAATSNPGVDLVAPGGNDATGTDVNRLVLVAESEFSALGFPGYSFQQGSSLAAGYVSGIVGMLITQGALEVIDQQLAQTPGLPLSARVDAMENLLTSTARNPTGGFDFFYGAGIVDAEAALKEITHWIDYSSPEPGEVTESFAEPLIARIVQPDLAIASGFQLTKDEFRVFKNGVDVTDEPNTEVLDPTSGSIRYQPTPDAPSGVYNVGSNELNLIAESGVLADAERSTVGEEVTDFVTCVFIPERTFRFRVRPRTEHPQLKMFSVPYELLDGADTLQFIAGGNVVALARWVPERRGYAIWYSDHSPQDPEADLITADAGVARPPIGVGYWARVANTTQLQILGASERSGFYEIPLRAGWNQIGNPYNFRVPWNTVNVRFGLEVMRVEEAFRRGLMRNALWRYENGRYTFQIPPRAELIPWESHWVFANVDVVLVVPRVVSSTGDVTAQAAPGGTRVASAGDGWRAAIRASSKGVTHGEVFLGASRKAANGYGMEDVSMPPAAPNPFELRIANGKWGRHAGRYAQDLRRLDAAQQWDLELETFRSGTPVRLSWDRFPRGTRAYLKVEGEREVHPLTGDGTVVLPPRPAGVRRLTVVAAPPRGA
jgi:hypothetical protein